MLRKRLSVLLLVFALQLSACKATPPSAERVELTEEQRAYLNQIEVSDPKMSAAQNFLGDTVIYLDAQITNRGDRAVRVVEIEMTFVDPWGQVVLKETGWPVQRRLPPLAPGETRPFQLAFERVPFEWNQAPPKIAVRRVDF